VEKFAEAFMDDRSIALARNKKKNR
jgi:hypothetical protein